MMPNSPHLTAAFPAIWMIGATIVPVIPQWTAGEVADVIRNSEATVALTVPALAHRLEEARVATGSLRHLLVFGESAVPGAVNVEPLLAGLPPVDTPVDRSPSDMAILLYTSGTTGTPKGVVLTHENFLSGVDSAFRQNPEMDPGALLHTLPLTHVYGVLVQNLANGWGLSTVLLRQFEPSRALQAIEQHRVRYLPVVPTMLVYLLHYPDRDRYNTSSLFRITSGGAALPEKLRRDVERVFACRVDQGYGLSESSSVATGYEIRAPYRPGSVGRASPGIQIRIVDDQNRPLQPYESGEICLAGPNITPGYWRDHSATGRALSDGWLRTGDVGYLDEDGFLFITDRKKDLLKTSAGKFIAPQPIENSLKTSPYISNAMVVGDRRKFVVALVVPNIKTVAAKAAEQGITLSTGEEVAKSPFTRTLVQSEIQRLTTHLAQFETIKRFALLAGDFTFDNGALTFTMKLKRRVVEEQYHDVIESLYADVAEPRPVIQKS
jgi:long-chain acyl-CoA synthetase